MKKIHRQFISHLRSYRMFHFMFFTFVLLITSIVIHSVSNKIYAEDLLEQAFKPAMSNETIINLGAGKNAVGNEILRQGVGVDVNLGEGCMVNGNLIKKNDVNIQMNSVNYTAGDDHAFCQQILGGTWDATIAGITTEAPLIVRIAKFLLRITMVLAVTMVIFNGIMWIIESSKGAEVKDAKKNITLIVVGILIALMSLSIINLISSLTVSSLGTKTTSNSQYCILNGNILAGDALKKYICENSTFGTIYTGTWYPDNIGNRCKRNGIYTAITDGEMISKCIELGGEYKY
ncbi:MAG: hypothetical protein WC606_03875 [Candidatus Absconditabacterales bacterium]